MYGKLMERPIRQFLFHASSCISCGDMPIQNGNIGDRFWVYDRQSNWVVLV
jgi:hypothetical protein